MGFIKALRSLAGMSIESREQVKREISFYDAIEAHLAWKQRLNEYLEGVSKKELQPQTVCLDNLCELGKWIHGSGKDRFGQIELFKQLTAEHAEFHLRASKVVAAHLDGNTALAQKMLSEDFATQSYKTISCLTKLHFQVEGENMSDTP